MKKKLALLLALVMILSLVPMSAFAAPSRFSSTVDVDKTSVVADGSAAKFTVYLLESDGSAPAAGTEVFFASRRGTEETFYKGSVSDANKLTADANGVFKAEVDEKGKVEIRVTSLTPGSTKIAFSVGKTATAPASWNLVDYLNGGDGNEAALGIFGTKDITFTSAGANHIAISGKAGLEAGNKTANGIEYFTVGVRVLTAANGRPVAGETVKISANKTGVTFNHVERTTNAAGYAEFRVYSTRPEKVEVEVRAAGKTDTVDLTFVAGGLFNIERVSDDNQVLAKDTDKKTFKFKVSDVSGNMVKTGVTAGDFADIDVVDEPDDSNLSVTFKEQEASGNIVFELSKLAHEGKYKIRIALPNGKTAEVNFTVKKQGDVQRIQIAYDETGLALGASSGTPSIDTFDANGVKKSVDVGGKVRVISSNPSLIKVNADGSLTVQTNRLEDIGKVVTLTVVDEDNKLTATTTMTITGSVAGFTATPAAASTQVGNAAKVDIQFIDEKGNPLAVGDDVELRSAVILSKPADAKVSVEEGIDFSKKAKEVGKTYVDVTSDKAGDVVVQLLIEEKTSGAIYTQNVTVKFGAVAAQKPVIGAKSLVLTIGATAGVADGKVVTSDLAAFIKDGRTFVPVRFIAEQLGAEVSFTTNAEGRTETVTLTRPDLTVTITMGSNSIVVVKDGVSSTVTADVAAFVDAASGRTVLPFRALAEAMGATVSFGPEGGMVEWVKFEQ